MFVPHDSLSHNSVAAYNLTFVKFNVSIKMQTTCFGEEFSYLAI